MKIVALDLGKSKMVGCIYDTLTHEQRFDSAPLEPGTLRTVLEKERPARVVIEIGSSAGWVGDLVRAYGAELEVANPSHQAWRWRNVKRKTDRLDALKLAQLSAMNQLPKVYLPEGWGRDGGRNKEPRPPSSISSRRKGRPRRPRAYAWGSEQPRLNCHAPRPGPPATRRLTLPGIQAYHIRFLAQGT